MDVDLFLNPVGEDDLIGVDVLKAGFVDLCVEVGIDSRLEVEVEDFEHVDACAQGHGFGNDLILGG